MSTHDKILARLCKESLLARDVDRTLEIMNIWMATMKSRDLFVKMFTWAIPNKIALNGIKHFVGDNKVLEIGAGNGFWAGLLSANGVTNIIAIDIFSAGYSFLPENTFYPVINMSSEIALTEHSDADTLISIWPPYNEPMATNALRAFTGSKFVYIGEGWGGCNADDDFFRELDLNWTLVETIEIKKWKSIYDSLELYTRKI